MCIRDRSGTGVSLKNYSGATIEVASGATMSANGNVYNNTISASSPSIEVDGQLNVGGNWINNGTAGTSLSGTTGVIQFNGSSGNQNIGGTTATTFEGISINNSSGVTLTQNQNIATTLAFTAGMITTGAVSYTHLSRRTFDRPISFRRQP